MSVEAALLEVGALEPGDVVILNDPFRGGTHLPDITLTSAVYSRGPAPRESMAGGEESPVKGGSTTESVVPALLGYVASRAHHSDVGGMSPGSMPLAREIFQEGLRIPPVRLYRRGQRNDDLWQALLANVRTPWSAPVTWTPSLPPYTPERHASWRWWTGGAGTRRSAIRSAAGGAAHWRKGGRGARSIASPE